MKKDFYDRIIATASEDELAGILRVAVFDSDIIVQEYLELVARVNTIKEKKELGERIKQEEKA